MATISELPPEGLPDDFDDIARLLLLRLRVWARRAFGQDGDDILQEALLRACVNRHSIDWSHNPERWLVTVSNRIAYDLYRRRKVRACVELDVDEVPSRHPGPEQLLLSDEEGELLRRAFSELHPRHQRVLYLRFIEEMSTDDLAAELELTPGATRALIYRARRALGAALDRLHRGAAMFFLLCERLISYVRRGWETGTHNAAEALSTPSAVVAEVAAVAVAVVTVLVGITGTTPPEGGGANPAATDGTESPLPSEASRLDPAVRLPEQFGRSVVGTVAEASGTGAGRVKRVPRRAPQPPERTRELCQVLDVYVAQPACDVRQQVEDNTAFAAAPGRAGPPQAPAVNRVLEMGGGPLGE